MSGMIRLDVNNMMESRVGKGFGISSEDLANVEAQAKAAWQQVEEKRGTGWLEWTELPYQGNDTITEIENLAAEIRSEFDSFVLLGIGGSALGPLFVHEALHLPRSNELPKDKRGCPKMYFEDNVDPERMAALLSIIDPAKTCFNVITKSGGTAETMSQFLIIRDLLSSNPNWKKQVVLTTSASHGLLAEIARVDGLRSLVVPEGVGGRFSELSPVGLLPAAVGGVDIRALLNGAARMNERVKCADITKNPALMFATLQYVALTKMGRNIHVIMPYADSLKLAADWFVQLWAESIGKSETRDGRTINAGQTPVKALGVTDQHSQLQLYQEGPFDKAITFIKVESFRAETNIPHAPSDYPSDIRFLGGLTHSRLIEAERVGTQFALTSASRMNQTIVLPKVDEDTVGQLIYMLEMATAYMGELLDIDAFNQPGVEASKIATYATLNHPAEKYQSRRKEMMNTKEPDGKYIV